VCLLGAQGSLLPVEFAELLLLAELRSGLGELRLAPCKSGLGLIQIALRIAQVSLQLRDLGFGSLELPLMRAPLMRTIELRSLELAQSPLHPRELLGRGGLLVRREHLQLLLQAEHLRLLLLHLLHERSPSRVGGLRRDTRLGGLATRLG